MVAHLGGWIDEIGEGFGCRHREDMGLVFKAGDRAELLGGIPTIEYINHSCALNKVWFAASNMPANSHSSPARGKRVVLVASLLSVVAAFIFGEPQVWLNTAIIRVEGLGPWGPVLFIACYIIATVMMVPGSALTLAGGTLFGVVNGVGIVSLASTAGAAAAFLVGRFLARDAIAAKIARNRSFAALDRALSKQGWKIVALARLSPILPFTLLNYAFGLTSVKFTHYVLASWIAMLPGTFLYVYLGSLARVGVGADGKTPLEWTLYGVGLAATIAVTYYVAKMAKRAVDEAGLAPPSTAGDPEP